jgi:UDP-3-O-[3-hydroxymyristoyl] glucosamine N-acyltransferase
VKVISETDLHEATGLTEIKPFRAESLDLINGKSTSKVLSFVESTDFFQEGLENNCLEVLLISREIYSEFPKTKITLIPVDDPRLRFFQLHNYLASKVNYDFPSQISANSNIAPGASISATGVVIESNVVVENGAIVLPGTTLKNGCIIRANAVIGTEGFEHKKTIFGVMSVKHYGTTEIGERTEIGALSTVARGIAPRRNTIIGNEVRIDCNVAVAHGAHIGDRVFIAGGVSLGGAVNISADSWIGTGATLRDRISMGSNSRLAIGSLLLRDLGENEKAMGNPARIYP